MRAGAHLATERTGSLHDRGTQENRYENLSSPLSEFFEKVDHNSQTPGATVFKASSSYGDSLRETKIALDVETAARA